MEIVRKTWGWEHWFANTDQYCGKLLYVRLNEWSSKGKFHYHKIKDETFFVVSGTLKLVWIDEDEIERFKFLSKNESFRIFPGCKHKFTAINAEGCEFIEASTTHRDEDSYRCYRDESGKWVEV